MPIQINSNTPLVRYTATSGQTTFTYNFPIFANADLKVVVNGITQTLTTNYTVTGAGTNAGGNVVFVSGLTTDDSVTIYSDIAIDRTIEYQDNGDLLADTLNTDFNRLTRQVQQTAAIGGTNTTGLRFDPDSGGLPLNALTGSVDDRKGNALSFNDTTGQPEATFSLVDNIANKTAAAASQAAALASQNAAATSATNAATSASGAAAAATTGVQAVLASDNSWTGDQTLRDITETNTDSAVNFTPDLTDGSIFTLTSAGTVTMPTAEDGKSFTIIINVGTNVTWAGSPKWHRGTEPSKSSGVDIYSFISNGTNWFGGQSGFKFS